VPRSIRTRLQATFVLLALTAIATTGWIVSSGASAALREATYDRLTAIRENKRHALERYFLDMGRHVVALSTNESTSQALREFQDAWAATADHGVGERELAALQAFYRNGLGQRIGPRLAPADLLGTWFPQDPRTRALQYQAIAANPHPAGAKDLQVEFPATSRYGDVHARRHPGFQRYRRGFGFYDIFLVSAPEGRVLYTVMKEVDLGMSLTAPPYAATALGRVYRRLMAREETGQSETAVFEDFAPYLPSALAPAAFVAAPVRFAGATIGMLAMQLSIEEVDQVMTGGQQWPQEGLGASGQAYALGPDGTLRSDLRRQIENPEAFYGSLARAGVAPANIDRIRHDGTSILNLSMDRRIVQTVRPGAEGAELGVSLDGTQVLRSHATLAVPDLQWTLVAEIDADEALAPVRALQARILTIGLVVAALFFVAAGWLGASLTRPLMALERAVARVGAGLRGATVNVRANDEIGRLAAAFNHMSADLERTTVSKSELEALAGRLISAQEDERRRVGRELHDDLVQRLAAAAIEVGRLERAPSATDAQAGLGALKKTVATLGEDVHRLSRRIHPAVLEELGLAAAVEAECRAFVERGGPPVDVRIEGDIDAATKAARLGVYRIAQESLRNILQHAGASEVSLVIRRESDTLSVEVADDGRGFNRNDGRGRGGLGLASMEERARLLGGRFEASSAAGQGTRIRVSVPVTAGDDEASNPAR
jgi:signal transduction histidine kinase